MSKNDFDYIWSDKKRSIFGLPLTFTKYFITETKFITRTGFFNINEDELDLYRVTDKRLRMSFWERLVGCGSITLNAKDTDTPIKLIDSVKHPRKVLELLDKQVNDQRDKYHIRGRDMMGVRASDDHDDCDIDADHDGF